MKYEEAREKQALNNLMYSLETIEEKDHLDESIERLFNHLTKLEDGEKYIIELEDVLKLLEIRSYCEGLLIRLLVQ